MHCYISLIIYNYTIHAEVIVGMLVLSPIMTCSVKWYLKIVTIIIL